MGKKTNTIRLKETTIRRLRGQKVYERQTDDEIVNGILDRIEKAAKKVLASTRN